MFSDIFRKIINEIFELYCFRIIILAQTILNAFDKINLTIIELAEDRQINLLRMIKINLILLLFNLSLRYTSHLNSAPFCEEIVYGLCVKLLKLLYFDVFKVDRCYS